MDNIIVSRSNIDYILRGYATCLSELDRKELMNTLDEILWSNDYDVTEILLKYLTNADVDWGRIYLSIPLEFSKRYLSYFGPQSISEIEPYLEVQDLSELWFDVDNNIEAKLSLFKQYLENPDIVEA